MTVLVYLRQNQSTPLTYAQGDANFQNLANAVNAGSPPTGGPTASRPAAPLIYQPYWDTDLGFIIWCTQTLPSTIIWSNAAGVAV